jgi:hypothetical protein
MSSTDPGARDADGVSMPEPSESEVDELGDEPTDGVAETDLPGVAAEGETLAPKTTRGAI